MSVFVLASTLALAGLGVPAENQAPVQLWGHLDPGPRAVGFQVLKVADRSRRLASGDARPVQISIWYPAQPSTSASQMRYEDYVRVTAGEVTARRPAPEEEKAAIDGYRSFMTRNGIGEEALSTWLSAGLAAERDALPYQGSFPLVVIAQGMGGAVQDQALLGEYLASHSFVVATSPSQLRLGDEVGEDGRLFPSAAQQERDLAVIVGRMRSFGGVDPRRIAAVGYSFGARSALLFALRRPSVKALVSIDGGIANRSGATWLKGSGIDASALAVPLLHLFEDTDEAVVPDFNLIASMRRSNRLLLKVASMRHLDFITYGMASALIPGLRRAAPDPAMERRFMAVLRYTRAFLETNLKGSSDAAAFLAREPTANDLGAAIPAVIRMPSER